MSAGTSPLLSVAQNYIARQWTVVPIDHKQKAPKIKEWEKLKITVDNAGLYFNGAEQNIGVQLGARSNGLSDVDLDCPEAVRLAPHFLPPTDAVFGRASKPSSHYLYLIGDAPAKATEQLKDENKKTIIELRMGGGGAAAQTVFPGSTHPSGETIQWVKNGTPAKSNYGTLKKAITKIAIGVLLIRQWPKGSGHEAALTVGGLLARSGWSAEEIGDFISILTREAGELPTEDDNKRTAKNAAEAHINGQHSFGFPKLIEDWGEKSAKAIAKILGYKGEKSARATGSTAGLAWRERRANGMPLPSMHNARLAITALGIECSFDTFHKKMLFGFKNETFRHSIGDEVSDNAMIRLRQIMSDRFGFDLTDRHTGDAVISLALESCFDPVCDMLDKAEADWDGTERLDKMAVDYFNCADTPLNRAFVHKMMIAAVRRARRPGCKFDNIVVLESDEGWNKSSALRELAGDDNFSDQSILGIREKEVQELLGPIWIHESADLSGMRKADVQAVKAFASRQEDIARPAYGRFVTRQPRHAINVGTTNDEEYLQSQTGNRRFWPLKVLKSIDIEKLRRDRLQLWGEAAKYEHAGESITIPEELWSAASDAQEKRRTKDPWENIVANLPETIQNDFDVLRTIIHTIDGQERVSGSDLLTHVLRIPIGQQKTADAMRLSTVMQRAGWERGENKITIYGKQVRGFFRWIKDV
jgi:predicted P-loop ATPase